ncbi:hypothetical protein F5Y03DRAFT_339861 [Xylaria venustula]|nr:hypothetical protein F5Y03DRAFT_339861 [Xylaria venustula]
MLFVFLLTHLICNRRACRLCESMLSTLRTQRRATGSPITPTCVRTAAQASEESRTVRKELKVWGLNRSTPGNSTEGNIAFLSPWFPPPSSSRPQQLEVSCGYS